MGQVEGAVYWADKLVSLSTEAEKHPEDVYSQGQALVSAKPYHRAATIAIRNNLHKSHVTARVIFKQLAYNHHFFILYTCRRPPAFTWS